MEGDEESGGVQKGMTFTQAISTSTHTTMTVLVVFIAVIATDTVALVQAFMAMRSVAPFSVTLFPAVTDVLGSIVDAANALNRVRAWTV